jgi:hypothetical protein
LSPGDARFAARGIEKEVPVIRSEEEEQEGGLEPQTPKDPGPPLDPDVTEPGQQPADPDIPQEPAPER